MPERWPGEGRRVLTPDNTLVDLSSASDIDINADFAGDQTLYQNCPDPLDWAKKRDIEVIHLPKKPREPEPEVVIFGGEPGEEIYFPV